MVAEKQTVTAKAVDFSNVKDGGDVSPKRIPAGDYEAKIAKVFDSPSKKDNVFQWCFVITVTGTTGSYPYYCKLQENQLWKLRNLFIAAGKNVPKKRVKVDPSTIVGKTIGVTMEDDEYDGKLKSTVAAVFPAADLDDSVVPGDEDDEEEYEDEEEATDNSEEEYEDEEPEEDDEEEEEEEEEEPEPTPPPRRAAKRAPAKRAAPAKKAAPASRAKKAAASVTDDELEELDIDEV